MRRLLPVVLAACAGDDRDSSTPAMDADFGCPPGRICLATSPVDASAPPDGRIVVAWQPASGNTWYIAVDRAWPSQELTELNLAEIAAPLPSWQFTGPCGANVRFGSATIVLSTDPDGDGSISSDEINQGYLTGNTYGIHQEIITWSDIGCGPSTNLPSGLEAGVHVYGRDVPVMKLDGTVTILQTCEPRSSACQNVENPF